MLSREGAALLVVAGAAAPYARPGDHYAGERGGRGATNASPDQRGAARYLRVETELGATTVMVTLLCW